MLGVYLSCSCGLSGQFRGRKALRSWPASRRVPSGRQRSPAIYIGFIPFPSTGPTHPTERKSQLHSLCPPKTICYGTHIIVYTHTSRDTLRDIHLVYLQGTLPHSKEVITTYFLSLWELHWGQDIRRFVRDRQRAILDIDTVSYVSLTIVCLMENIVEIYKGQGVKCIFITLKQEKRIYIKLRQGQGETRFLI